MRWTLGADPHLLARIQKKGVFIHRRNAICLPLANQDAAQGQPQDSDSALHDSATLAVRQVMEAELQRRTGKRMSLATHTCAIRRHTRLCHGATFFAMKYNEW